RDFRRPPAAGAHQGSGIGKPLPSLFGWSRASPPIVRARMKAPGTTGDGRVGVRTDTTVRRLLSVDEVAEVLGVPVRTLHQWRHKGVGPLGLRVGRHLRYREV